MQIVIEISEEEYKCVQLTGHIGNATAISNAILNGTPLPEHLELVDKKEVYKKFYSRCLAKVATEVLSEVTTIIPATKEGE